MKLYPFSVQKHAHDIEFRKNRIFCQIHDVCCGETLMSEWEYQQLERLYDELATLLNAVLYNSRDGKVVYLTGSQIRLAKETVLWAKSVRANSLIEAGKTEYLKYL